jgi:transposase
MIYAPLMAGIATSIVLVEEERAQLTAWARKGTTEQRIAERARIVLAAAAGQTTKEIASQMELRPATVSKWRTRFARDRLAGLGDSPRSGKPPRYGEDVTQRILAVLDEPPPAGYSSWNGRLVAEALGDVTESQVWRVLRGLGISLQRRRSWCISTDPQFAQKAADIVGLYLDPPDNAVVVSVDEKPAIQALERAQGWLRLPNGGALRGQNHEYKRHGTTTLFAALEVHTGITHIRHSRRRRRREFLDFMNSVVALYPETELHVVLDNLNIHKPKHDRWLARHPHVHFHYTPTHASWLNQVEIWFSILTRSALRGLSATSPREVCAAIDRFTGVRNENPIPFEWTKAEVNPVAPVHRYADLRK